MFRITEYELELDTKNDEKNVTYLGEHFFSRPISRRKINDITWKKIIPVLTEPKVKYH